MKPKIFFAIFILTLAGASAQEFRVITTIESIVPLGLGRSWYPANEIVAKKSVILTFLRYWNNI